jgi:hypothetical protein
MPTPLSECLGTETSAAGLLALPLSFISTLIGSGLDPMEGLQEPDGVPNRIVIVYHQRPRLLRCAPWKSVSESVRVTSIITIVMVEPAAAAYAASTQARCEFF